MKRALTILLLVIFNLTVIPGLNGNLAAAPKTPIRVGSYEISNSFNRRVQAEKGNCSPQRMWRYSAVAVADAIIDADCDIMGLQDVCDTIAGRRDGVSPFIDILKERGGDYEWLVLSNANPNYPLEGTMANGNAIIWRASRFELRDWGIYWLSGIFDKPGRAPELKYGSANTSMMWVKLYDKSAGKELIFTSASLAGPTQYDKGQKVVYPEINVATAKNLLDLMRNDVVPFGMPSIIAVSAHNAPGSDGGKMMNSSVWLDVHNVMNDEGTLDEGAIKVKDCSNSVDEGKIQGGRSDHIFEDGFTVESYAVLRKKFPTADGTLHYPAFHFPLISDLKY